MNVIVDNDSISKSKGNSLKKAIKSILTEYLFPLLHFIQQQPPPSPLLMNLGLFLTSLQLLIYSFQTRVNIHYLIYTYIYNQPHLVLVCAYMEQRHPLHRDKPVIPLLKVVSDFKRERSNILHSVLPSDNNLLMLLDHIRLLHLHDEARQSEDCADVSFSVRNSTEFTWSSAVPPVLGNTNIN
jgi:hypothetical protein